MLGIQETKDVIIFGASLGNAIGESLENDGKITLGEYTNFIPALLKVPAALTGITDVKAELLDLDETEKVELIEFVKSEFDIADDAAEEFVESTVTVALEFFNYVNKYFLKS